MLRLSVMTVVLTAMLVASAGCSDATAVVTSITSGSDDDGVWVETWSFALSVIDSKRIHATSHRQVNNKNLHLDHPDAAWASIVFGVLERVPDADVKHH